MKEPLAAVDWPVRTERLLLRRAEVADLDPIWRYRQRPEVTEWVTAAPATFAEHCDDFIRKGLLAQMVVVERDGRVIGDSMVRVEDAWAQREVADEARDAQAELGWILDPEQHGHGYATEAVRAIVGLCFGPLRLRRVYAECFADNEPSWRLMERLGMRREVHTVRDSLHRTRGWLDGLSYALLAEEWPAAPVEPRPR